MMVVLGPREETGGGYDKSRDQRSFGAGRNPCAAGRKNMSLVAEATNIHGLIVYLIGMILIGGAMTWANYIDDQRDKRRQASAKR
jgi:hypothetical protein